MALRRILSRRLFTKQTKAVLFRSAHGESEGEGHDEEFIALHPDTHRLISQDYTIAKIKVMVNLRKFDEFRESQRLKEERLTALGPELAAAHFIISLGGAVKIKGRKNWIRSDMLGSYALPRFKNDTLVIEGIDASNTELLYEGFENIERLRELKFLNLSNCKYIDDFCMSRLETFGEHLEVLDVGNCDRITENGIACIHNCPHLKVLNISETPKVLNKELLTLSIETLLPDCIVYGVDHLLINEGLQITDNVMSDRISQISAGTDSLSQTGPSDQLQTSV